MKYNYHRRKVVWDQISLMVRAGFTAHVACDRILEVYGAGSNFFGGLCRCLDHHFFFSYSTFLGLVAALANGIKACPATPTPNTLSTMLYKMAVTKTLEVYSGLDVSIPEK